MSALLNDNPLRPALQIANAMNILVVDDDKISRLTIAHTLKNAGYDVVSACDGREALELLRSNPISLVVTDWNMPHLNGVELCREIRRANFPRYVYVILLTGHAELQDTLDGLEAGADDFITKPFNPAELVLRVKVGQRTIALDTRDLTIFAMGKLAESRDSETGAHLSRISSYCRVLARRILDHHTVDEEIDEDFVQLIHKTSPLHDIGKIGIPDCILLKPDRLDENEFGIMKMHTMLGARMLDAAQREFPNAGFLWMARDIALSHHERYDGSGYPQGLRGTGIPLCARIATLADVYDALTTKRVYKNAFSHESAASIITDKSKGQFDPAVVAAFLAEERQFTAIRAQYVEDEMAKGFETPNMNFPFPLTPDLAHADAYLPSFDRG